MIKHLVLWNLKSDTPLRDVDEITFQLLQLKKLDEVLELSVLKSNLKSSSRSYCLNVVFLNEKDYQSYLEHPDHIKVSNLINQAFCDRVCFDVEY